MRRVAFLALLLAASCATDPIRFTGQDVTDQSSSLRVLGNKEESFIVVMNGRRGCVVALPYSEDWVFEPTPEKPIFGSSAALQMAVTVQSFQPGLKVTDEGSYLRSEYLSSIKKRCEKEGLPLLDAGISKGDSAPASAHPVLEYRHEIPTPDGGVFRQAHFWGFRQRPDNLIFEIHLSKAYRDPARLPDIRAVAHLFLGTKFLIVNP